MKFKLGENNKLLGNAVTIFGLISLIIDELQIPFILSGLVFMLWGIIQNKKNINNVLFRILVIMVLLIWLYAKINKYLD